MRMDEKRTFWITVLVSAAFLAFGALKSLKDGLNVWNLIALSVGALLLLLAYLINGKSSDVAGGAGGSAAASGHRSDAQGGAGGRGIIGTGGYGGDASAAGDDSNARGGRGGDA